MKKHKSYILAIAFTVISVFFLGITAYAVDLDYSSDYYKTGVYNYEIIDNVVYEKLGHESVPYYNVVSFVPNEKVGKEVTEINILTEIDGCPVKTISHADVYFRFECPNIKKIVIPEGITEIGEYTFKGLINAEEIVLPETVEEIGGGSFVKLTKLKEITLPSKITKISDSAFLGCTNLKTVIFKGDVTHFGDGAFNGCKALESVDLSKAEYIGANAFYDCANITEIKFSDNLKNIDCGAFAGTSIKTLTIPAKTSLKCYCEYEDLGGPFYNCKKLKTVIFEDVDLTQRSDKKVYIPQNTFENCSALETVILPSNEENIAIYDRAFKNCKKLKTVGNFENVYKIGEAAFAYCTSLKSAVGIGADIGVKAFLGCKALKTVKIDGSRNKTDSIGKRAFENCTGLKKLYLPDDGSKIAVGDRAFKKCTALTKIYNSDYISSIGTASFAYCKSLLEITFYKYITKVGEKAFLGCSKLARVTLESSKTAPDFSKKAFSSTASGIKFITSNSTVAKSVKANIKGTGTKNARVYIKTTKLA